MVEIKSAQVQRFLAQPMLAPACCCWQDAIVAALKKRPKPFRRIG